jgi:hypothetical protein
MEVSIMKNKKMWITFPHYLCPSGFILPLTEYKLMKSIKKGSRTNQMKKLHTSLMGPFQNLHWREL